METLKGTIYSQLMALTVDTLRPMAQFLLGPGRKKPANKDEIATEIARFLDFKNQEEFDAFFSSLKPWLKETIQTTVFWEFVHIPSLEKKYNITILKRGYWNYSYNGILDTEAEKGLSFFKTLKTEYLWLIPLFREAFLPFLPKPEGYTYEGTEQPDELPWSNEGTIFETLNLLINVCEDVLKSDTTKTHGEWIRKGMNKTLLNKVRPLCGQAEFSLSKKYRLDPIDLFFRWYVTLRFQLKHKDEDSLSTIQNLIKNFFAPNQRPSSSGPFLGAWTEFYILNDHLSLKNTNDAHIPSDIPPSRNLFYQVFYECAKNRTWYSVEDLYWSLYLRERTFSYTDYYTEMHGLRRRGDQLVLNDNQRIVAEYDRYVYVWGPQRNILLGLPLFRGYWYLMALLGLVEITETEPNKPLYIDGQERNVSSYDCLSHIRVTPLGAYCLGLQKEYQIQNPRTYEAIADKELLLVTFRGHSLERKLFLQQIGIPLGMERYRISEDSFIRGCENPEDLQLRIKKFKTLIDSEPSERWERFFKDLNTRASLLSDQEGAFIFNLHSPPSVVQTLLVKAKVRGLCFRAEGNRLVVRSQDYKKFCKLVQEEGFFTKF